MGSLNSNGTVIVRTNRSYRNIGRAITANEIGQLNDISIDMINEPGALIVVPTRNDDKLESISYGNTVKVTSSHTDSLVERQFSQPADLLAVPAVDEDKVQYSAISQGVAVKLTESLADTLIDRNFN
jgi:hypothetical protein